MSNKGTVLLVEDNVELNSNNIRALKMLGYTVHSVLTLEEALLWLKGNEPDVILLDVMLPDGDGIDFCAKIRGIPFKTAAHILFLTARTGHEDRVRGLENGGDDYISKPFHPEELLARVDAAMRRRSMEKKALSQEQGNDEGNDKRRQAFAAYYGFTPRETEVLILICLGLSSTVIEQKLGISENTLRPYVSRMLKKCGAKNRTELVVLASAFSE